MMKYPFLLTLFMFILMQIGFSQTDYVPSSENLETREWFQDAKFGLFIHWGVYSVLGNGEWVMQKQTIGTILEVEI